MSWTPYVGDPAVRIGTVAGLHRTTPERFVGDPNRSRRPGMSAAQRMQTSVDGGVGTSMFTPDQSWFRRIILAGRAGSFVPVAPHEDADRQVNVIRRHPCGACDLISLEALARFHVDLGGRGARDVRVGRPL